MFKRSLILPVLLLLFISALAIGQYGGRRVTVWSGVYSADQAAKGEVKYGQCRGCHGPSLDGNGSTPPLRGDRFMEHWREDNLDSLFSFIKNTMPPRANTGLTEADTVEIVSYILQSNDFPAGNDALAVGSLPGIRIEGQNGPQPLPEYALVHFVGCMAKNGNNWDLVQASAPVRVRKPGRPTPEELKAAEGMQIGSQTVHLTSLSMAGMFDPETHTGHKMYAKGALLKQQDGSLRVSLTSMDMLTTSCL